MATEAKEQSKFMRDFMDARRTGCPLVIIETADPATCIRQVAAKSKNSPIVCWDKSQSITYKNDMGKCMLEQYLEADQQVAEQTTWGPSELEQVLKEANKFPGKDQKVNIEVEEKNKKRTVEFKLLGGTILFIMNGHRFIDSMEYQEAQEVRQALWNLRDRYKTNLRMVVLLCPSIRLPEELKHDFIILDHPLPTPNEIGSLTKKIFSQTHLPEPEEKVITNIGQEVNGLSLFAIEQVMSMSITEAGMDMERLWMHKKKSIEQTPGLKIWRGPETYKDVQGIPILKEYGSMLMESDDGPTYLIFMDELEKQLAGTEGSDTTMQEMHGQMLSWMADEEILGLMEVGQPGCSKSFFAKALAGQYKRLLVILNLSEVKSKWVGESTGQMKSILKTLTAIGKPLLIATSNNISKLSPELRDRFNLGTFFLDFPDIEGRKPLWKQYKDKYGITSDVTWNDDMWSPRNIRDCCSLANRLKCSLEKASKKIVPVKQSDLASIYRRREMADGKFLSAEVEGVYSWKKEKGKEVFTPEEGMRAIEHNQGFGEA
jgi:ATPase family protein associated with various cellular activities (AAA)